MSQFIVVTYDLLGATSNEYPPVQRRLENLGLRRTIRKADGTRVRLPHNTVAMRLVGQSAGRVRDRLTVAVRRVFVANGVRARFFMSVGSRWAWSKGVV
jgi:hypothetical protein